MKPKDKDIQNSDIPINDSEIPINEMEFSEFMEKELVPVKTGEIVKGLVVAVDDSGVIVDIGYKSEGLVPINEFQRASDGTIGIKPGDEMDVYVISKETPTGLVALSKNIAEKEQGSSDLTKAFHEHTTLQGKVLSHNKSGFIVDYKGTSGFMPFSQSGLTSSNDAEEIVGQKVKFHVIDLDIRRKRIIFSRKQAIEEERFEKKKILMENLKEGDRIKGHIKTLTNYGAFIDIGGMDGLLHISDISWKQIKSPDEVIKAGQDIEVMILKIDKESGRISLGLKQLEQDPWSTVEIKYTNSSIINGKVTALTDYGAFVELEPGIEGMVHISEMSWTQRIEHPSKVVNIGDQIQAKILNIDKANRRISLGIRQTQPDPWDKVEEKYPVGTVVKSKITALTSQGAVVKIEEGVEGFILKTDFSWIKPINHPSEIVKEGDELEARVIKLNVNQRKIGLGIKQLTPDPWLGFFKKNKEGSIISGKVTKIANSGIFVELEGGLEGFCRISQLDSKRVENIESFCKIGDVLEFKLVRLQKAQKRIVLSRRTMLEDQERAVLSQYTKNVQEAKTNLGELLEEASSSISRTGEENG